MKTMQFKTMIIALISAVVLFTSCKKEETIVPPPPQVSVAGIWEGTYKPTGSPFTNYYGFKINQDGTLLIKTKADAIYTASGTWTLTDGTFKATYNFDGKDLKYFLTAKTNLTNGTMTGSYASGTEDNTVGEYNLQKK